MIVSAGIMLFNRLDGLKVFLVHPGGPLYAQKDEGVWSIPKGEVKPEENLLDTAKREFEEETSIELPKGRFYFLEKVKNKSGKIIYGWAVEYNLPIKEIKSNTFEMEYPKGSGDIKSFPEVDKGDFFDMETARKKIHPPQIPFLEILIEIIEPKHD